MNLRGKSVVCDMVIPFVGALNENKTRNSSLSGRDRPSIPRFLSSYESKRIFGGLMRQKFETICCGKISKDKHSRCKVKRLFVDTSAWKELVNGHGLFPFVKANERW